MESLAKNCGRTIHEQVARGPFMEEMWDVVRVADRRKDDTVKGKALELIQNWAVAFKNAGAEYKVVSVRHAQLKRYNEQAFQSINFHLPGLLRPDEGFRLQVPVAL